MRHVHLVEGQLDVLGVTLDDFDGDILDLLDDGRCRNSNVLVLLIAGPRVAGYARRVISRMVLLAGTFVLGLATAVPAQAEAGACEFRLGFGALHQALAGRVGDCLDNETYSANGDSIQHASGGLLVWRHTDNWTAFTDGYRTWVNGPYGIQERLNTERFPWEAGVSPVSPPAPSSTTSSTSCTAVAQSGSVSAVGLNSSTVITGSGSGDTTVVNNQSSSSSSPGVTRTGC